MGSARQKNAIFWSKKIEKCPKTLILPVFQIFGQSKVFLVIWETSENQFDSPKKSQQSFRYFFENPPPLEKILDPPLNINICGNVISQSQHESKGKHHADASNIRRKKCVVHKIE